MRVAALQPDAAMIPGPIRAIAAAVMPAAAIAALGPPLTSVHGTRARAALRQSTRPPSQTEYPSATLTTPAFMTVASPAIPSGRSQAPPVQPQPVQPQPQIATIAAPFRPIPVQPGQSRLTASVWLLARGGPAGTLSGGQLGASQAGIRVTYALGESRRFALAARLAAPLAGRGREAALGVEWQPTRWPVRFIAEQRFVLDGGHGGPTLGVIGGYGPAEIAPGVRFETYAQAGAIARARTGDAIAGRIEGFVDAAARLTHPIATLGRSRFDGGVGAWASAQRGAERLDIGPTLGLALPIQAKSFRLSLDWRERIGGAARPGSGPALSIGTDF